MFNNWPMPDVDPNRLRKLSEKSFLPSGLCSFEIVVRGFVQTEILFMQTHPVALIYARSMDFKLKETLFLKKKCRIYKLYCHSSAKHSVNVKT